MIDIDRKHCYNLCFLEKDKRDKLKTAISKLLFLSNDP